MCELILKSRVILFSLIFQSNLNVSMVMNKVQLKNRLVVVIDQRLYAILLG